MDFHNPRHSAILLILCTFNLSFFRYIKTTDPCQDEQIGYNICEPVCVSQVGLSILRVTFNNFLVTSECVKEAHLSFWLTNSSRNSAIDVKLVNNDVWKQDCTLTAVNNNNVISNSNHQFTSHIKEKHKSKNKVDIRMAKQDRYIYLHGLNIGGAYTLQLNVILKSGINGRTQFLSQPTWIMLSIEEWLKENGLIRNINQGRCCKPRSRLYHLDDTNGYCIRTTTKQEEVFNFNTFLLSLLIFLLLIVVIVNMIFHLKKLVLDRRWYQNSRVESGEVAFKYITEPEEIHPDMLATLSRNSTMNRTLLKNSTITIRLPPHGEELLVEELKSRLSRQSI